MKHPIAAFLLCLFLCSCSEEDTPLFVMEYSVEIPFFPETNTAKALVVRDDGIRSTFDQMLSENNLNSEDVRVVRVRSARLFPLDHNIDYGTLRRIEVNIFDLNDPDDLLPIADLQPLPSEDRGALDLLPGLPNVLEYVEQPIFGLDIGYSYRRPFQLSVNNVLRLELEAIGI